MMMMMVRMIGDWKLTVVMMMIMIISTTIPGLVVVHGDYAHVE